MSVVPGDPGSGNQGGAQAYFDELVTAATARLVGDEVLLANISGERTDFIRLNNSDVRLAGTIDQQSLSVDLIEGKRLSGEITDNAEWREARVAQEVVAEAELVAKVKEILAAQAEDRRRAKG